MALLPGEFAALEPFAATWCLATERERWAARMASSMEELQGFYDAIFPRVEEAIAFCDTYPLDTMPDDVRDGLAALARRGGAAEGLSRRMRGYLDDGSVRLHTNWHSVTSLFYFEMPEDLRLDLAGMDLVLLKGDVNYRRLLGDVHWPPVTSFADATAYFPAPLAALRTMKGELVVGLGPGVAEGLDAEDSAWMVNGRRGLVQARF